MEAESSKLRDNVKKDLKNFVNDDEDDGLPQSIFESDGTAPVATVIKFENKTKMNIKPTTSLRPNNEDAQAAAIARQ